MKKIRFAPILRELPLVVVTLLVASCGGSTGGTVINPPPTITSVSVACSPTAIETGQTSTCTATVVGTGDYTSSVTWKATGGTVSTAGVFTPTGTGTATITANSAQSGYTTVSGSGTVTVTAPPPTITSVSVACSPTAIETGQTSTCTATVVGTGDYTSSVTWKATGGTVSTAGVFTPTGTGTATITANSAQSGYTTVSGSGTVTVTIAVPNVTSVTPSSLYQDDAGNVIGGFELIGSGFASTDVICPNFDNLLGEQLQSSTEITMDLGFGGNGYSPGFLTFAVAPKTCGTNMGTSASTAFLGAQPYLAVSASGEVDFLDQAGKVTSTSPGYGYVGVNNADGSQKGNCMVGFRHGLALDDKTGFLLADNQIYDPTTFGLDGVCFSPIPNPQGIPSGEIMSVAASDGYAGFVQPANNSVTFYDLVSGNACTTKANSVGSSPWAMTMGVFVTEADAFIFSRNGTPLLSKVRASDCFNEGSVALPGITPQTTVFSKNQYVGGWQIASLPSTGIIAVLSTTDNLLLLVNASTMEVVKSVTLAGIPFRIAPDVTHETFVVAFAHPENTTTTYSSVDASGTVVEYTSTDTLLSVGLAVSADGKSLYSGQRNQLHVLKNQ